MEEHPMNEDTLLFGNTLPPAEWTNAEPKSDDAIEAVLRFNIRARELLETARDTLPSNHSEMRHYVASSIADFLTTSNVDSRGEQR